LLTGKSVVSVIIRELATAYKRIDDFRAVNMFSTGCRAQHLNNALRNLMKIPK
jgi:hypothetical protein